MSTGFQAISKGRVWGAVIVDVVAAVIRREGKILITRRFDHVHLPRFWEFPGGKVEQDESLEAALHREIREELGVDVHIADELCIVEHQYSTKFVRLHFFNCAVAEGEPQPIEVADMRWVEPAELDQFQFPPADVKLIELLRK